MARRIEGLSRLDLKVLALIEMFADESAETEGAPFITPTALSALAVDERAPVGASSQQ
jgi:hypothetical protein